MASHLPPLPLRQLAGIQSHGREACFCPPCAPLDETQQLWNPRANVCFRRRVRVSPETRNLSKHHGFFQSSSEPWSHFQVPRRATQGSGTILIQFSSCSLSHNCQLSPQGATCHPARADRRSRRHRWRAHAGEAAQRDSCPPPGQQEYLEVAGVSYRPTGSTSLLLQDVNLSLPNRSLGLIYGRSGSGKTTLLQVLAGLATAASGSICVGPAPSDGTPRQPCTRSELAGLAGIVFQFPERYFLAGSVLEELTFGWPRRPQDLFLRQSLALRLQAALFAVGLTQLPLDADPRTLSGGNQRRLALATQLVRLPQVLLLDEPLAGLDWQARADVVKMLADLKKERIVVVISHDLRELSPLVDRAWRMEMGGRLRPVSWPPEDFEDQAEAFRARAALAKQA